MLTTLSQAKKYAIEKIEELTSEKVDSMEQAVVETAIEQNFFDKIQGLVSDEELQEAQAKSEEELEGYLFHKIPNYATLLEQTTKDFLKDYL